ncbi:MAG: hypothetical protein P8074_17435 [Anaerolineales bacterium]
MKTFRNCLGLWVWVLVCTLIVYPASARSGEDGRITKAIAPAKATTSASIEWTIERVDDPRFVHPNFGDHAVQVDNLGHIHAAYGGDHLYYARCTGNSAQSCTVQTVDPQDYTGQYASLALDDQGNPRIAYFAASASASCDEAALKYARWTGSIWQLQEVDRGCRGEQISLALDAAGFPHISYVDSLQEQVWHAYWDGGEWRSEEVAAGRAPSIAVDGGDNLHLVYIGPDTQGSLWYRRKGADGWGAPYKLDSGDIFQHPALAVDSSGGLHISYSDVTRRKLRYANNSSGCWWMQDVDDMDYQGFTALTTNDQDEPVIVYQNMGVRYVYKSNAIWSVPELVVSGGDGYMSLAMDVTNQLPVLAYFQARGLYFSRRLVDWQAGQRIDQTAQTGLLVSMAADNHGGAHVVYFDESGERLRYAKSNGNTWSLENIVEDVQVDWADIALDPQGQPQVVFEQYLSHDSQPVRYFVRRDSTWQEGPAVNPDTGRAAMPSIQISPDGNPSVAFIDGSAYGTQKLVLAEWNGSNWHKQDIDQGELVFSPVLALSPAGEPQVAYAVRLDSLTETTDRLRYAFQRPQGSWNLEEIDSNSEIAAIEMAVSSEGTPHLAYLIHSGTDGAALRHSYWDGETWLTEEVGVFTTASDISLALDASGHPHIGFMYEQSLFYARKESQGWAVSEWLDSSPVAGYDSFSGFNTAVGDYQDLVLDAAGQPLFVYHGEMDLKAAYRRVRRQLFLPMMQND